MHYTEEQAKQLKRLEIAEIVLNNDAYLQSPDFLELTENAEIPEGYKRCGRCHQILKFYLFNVNNNAKNKCTGNCKQCQKNTAQLSYERTKHKRDYKQYYEQNKERKQEVGRQYYQKNKETILEKQKKYNNSKVGKKVMRKAHKKRRQLLATNKGIKYERDWVIDRDRVGEHPICYLCGESITVLKNLQLDHVVPVVLGGSDCFTNIACTHTLCNLRKEKDARNLSAQQVEEVIKKAEKYVDSHPELFS